MVLLLTWFENVTGYCLVFEDGVCLQRLDHVNESRVY
jgi:hypothetical protein